MPKPEVTSRSPEPRDAQPVTLHIHLASDTAMEQLDRKPKPTVDYRVSGSDDNCAGCISSRFADEGQQGTCERVMGACNRSYVCDLFAPRLPDAG